MSNYDSRFGVHRIRLFDVALLFVLLLSMPLRAQVLLQTAAQSDTPPKYIKVGPSKEAPIIGLCIDINRALENADPHIKFTGDQKWMPARRIDAEMENGTLDAACGISKTVERQDKVVFAEPALFSSKFVLVVRKDDDVAVNGWDDVRALGNNGIVLVDYGFGSVSYLTQLGGLQVDAGTSGIRDNLLKLKWGRGRFYYHRALGLEEEIKRLNMQGDVKILPVAMGEQKFYMAFGRHISKTVVDRTQEAISTIIRNGDLKRIVQKWTTGPDADRLITAD